MTRRGTPCGCPAMWSERSQSYTRCRLHGGASTGPKTPDGLAASRKARWVHGNDTGKARRDRQEMRWLKRLFFAESEQVLRIVWRGYIDWVFDQPYDPAWPTCVEFRGRGGA